MIRNILMLGEPALFEASRPVTAATSPEVGRLAQDMRETLEAAKAIAIAAPQVGSLDRVIVLQLPSDRIPQGSAQTPLPWTAMVNPELEMLTEAEQNIYERCLSIPGYYARIPRCARVRMRYTDLDGVQREIVGTGYLAALLQHEYDHLDGILYPMRMRSGREMAAVAAVCGNGNLYRSSVAEFDGGPA